MVALKVRNCKETMHPERPLTKMQDCTFVTQDSKSHVI